MVFNRPRFNRNSRARPSAGQADGKAVGAAVDLTTCERGNSTGHGRPGRVERTMAPESLLVAGVGDIHGRFHRVEAWLDALEEARRRPVDLVLAVGDVEAFRLADDHRRKAAKRGMPAEFAVYADGVRAMKRPLYFIGGNNEDFEALHDEQIGRAHV